MRTMYCRYAAQSSAQRTGIMFLAIIAKNARIGLSPDSDDHSAWKRTFSITSSSITHCNIVPFSTSRSLIVNQPTKSTERPPVQVLSPKAACALKRLRKQPTCQPPSIGVAAKSIQELLTPLAPDEFLKRFGCVPTKAGRAAAKTVNRNHKRASFFITRCEHNISLLRTGTETIVAHANFSGVILVSKCGDVWSLVIEVGERPLRYFSREEAERNAVAAVKCIAVD
ncbi:MAG TPA: hypothetical protein DDZ51_09495 [Planctomycetaceae bacterium]|nr:hypothetical protein [Planctomycetaceae bacterium]